MKHKPACSAAGVIAADHVKAVNGTTIGIAIIAAATAAAPATMLAKLTLGVTDTV